MQQNITDFSLQECIGNCTGNATISSNASTTTSNVCLTIQTSFPKDIKGPLLSSVFGIGVNLTLAIFTVFFNLIVFIAMNRKEELKTAANLILKSMTASDFLVGLIVQPLKIVYLILHILDRPSCLVKQIDAYFGVICVGVSLFNICLFALDRCFATVYPYRYLEETIHSKYLITVISGWILLAMASLLTFAGVLQPIVIVIIMNCLFFSCMVMFIVSYVIIYKVVRAQRLKITSEQKKFHSTRFRNKVTDNTDCRDSQAGNVSTGCIHLPGPSTENITDQEVSSGIAVYYTESASNHNLDGMSTSTSLSTTSSSHVQARNSLPVSLQVQAAMPEASKIISSTEGGKVNKAVKKTGFSAKSFRNKADAPNLDYKKRKNAVLKRNARNYTVLIIVSAFLLCYLPGPILKSVYKDQKLNSQLLMIFDWTNTLVMLNSTINPLIYCWRVSTIRKEAKRILQRILCCISNYD